ncbi:MAG: carboxymuconolactone decarboxylase family protein [Myxococcota bacterium]|nr:carboxymuconolactone decarboxylase family protein [Myxococcota bacterium]
MIAPRVAPPQVDTDDPIASSVLAHQPVLLDAFLRLYGTLWSHGEVDQFTKEMARIRNARTVNCPICKATRFSGARAEGLTEAIVDEIRDGYAASNLAPRHKAVLAWVDAFLADPSGDHEPLRRELLVHFTPAQIVELTAGVGLFMGFSKIAVSLGGLPDEIPVYEQPTPEIPEQP